MTEYEERKLKRGSTSTQADFHMFATSSALESQLNDIYQRDIPQDQDQAHFMFKENDQKAVQQIVAKTRLRLHVISIENCLS